jgi:glycosyltransferase 2 family protein
MRKTVQVLLALAGLSLLGWMIHKAGYEHIKNNLAAFGFGSTLFLIALYTSGQVLFWAAWYAVLGEKRKAVGAWRSFLAYAAGDALNMTIPSGNLAGEPIKVMLVREHCGTEFAVASVTVYKFADFISLTLFLLTGWLFHFIFYALPTLWTAGASVILFGMVAFSFIFLYIQQKGFFHPAAKFLHRFGLEKWLENKLESAHIVDEGVRQFYIHHRKNFAWGVFFNFLAWFAAVVEIMIFMKLMGLEPSFAAALTLETFSLFVNNITFFVPARLGVSEGARTLIFTTLGYTKDIGLTYGIIRRIRELAWVGIGLIILAFVKGASPAQTPRAQS